MPRQPSPSQSTTDPQGTEVYVPTDSILAIRRPSWTPSISSLPEHEDIRTHSSLSKSKRRSKIHDEIPTPGLSVDWAGTPSSLSRARRPSFEPSTNELSQRARKQRPEAEQSDAVVVPPDILSSPEEGKGFRSSWEINVKKLVGDAVGNMSISPASRDIVLAARRGLFIIDLESRFSIPRFLPQGGTWDVADVQWNPHPSHAQYIVSTSSEKLLIWNLCLSGKTSIQHILKSHYRAITDINWHTTECDIVVSTGIDSWLWAWDLRVPRKPIFGLSAFQSGGTQVKWNYQDGNLLASSHSNEVLIWDRRKGSLPVTKIRAHTSKIYGIDWSRRRSNEIVTCSLDKTIKTWDINSTNSQANPEPKTCIQTTYPVWRARNLPFGEGILSLPQRSETTLEMYGKNEDLIETFEGHSDVVKEFVWRKGNNGDFQLITWSKDRTLRFWPIDAEVMHKVGHEPEIVRGRSKLTRNELEIIDTFRDPPEVQEYFPVFSAPIGPRAIFAEVRAPQPPKTVLTGNRSLGPTSSPLPATDDDNKDTTPTLTSASLKPILMPAGKSTGPTMSKGSAGMKNISQLDQLAWLASVKVGSKRGSNSSGTGSGVPSRLSSRSRPHSGPERSSSDIGARQRSGSLSRAVGDERKDGDVGQSLQDEITSVLTKLAASKIKLEKHDLTKKRTCTLGLHGPWGEKSSVFMRITFTFPREYPHAGYPHGTPVVELERNPLILMKDRAFILKHLRRIRERKRPCLEPCLRFLLFADEGVNDRDSMDSESSDDDDDDGGDGKKSREITVSLLRNHKNLAEPRSSQGSFGPNGELVSFFRAPPRIVRNVLRGLTNPSSMNSESTEPFQSPEEKQQEQEQQQPAPPKASYLRSPALVSDAVRRLGLAATDRIVPPIDPKQPETSSNILRAMTNLLTVAQPKARRDSETKYSNDDVSKNYSVFPTRRSIVFMTSTNNIAGSDKKVAGDYVFTVGSGSLADVCEVNAVAARNHGRYDHERVFRTLKMLFRERDHPGNKNKWHRASFTSNVLAAQVITRMYCDYVKEKDVQMLAMLSMVALQTEPGTILASSASSVKNIGPTAAVPPKVAGVDYFSLSKSAVNLTSPTSSEWSHLPPSPLAPSLTPSFSSSNSSRGSWSSLFNTGSMRQFMNGVQDSLKEGLSTPTETVASHGISTAAARSTEKSGRTGLDLPVGGSHKRRTRQESLLHARAPMVIPKSWNDGARQSPKLLSPSFSAGRRQHLLRFADTSSFINENQAVIFQPDNHDDTVKPLFDPQLIEQFKLNVYVYAELLFRWQLFHKRLELLKAVGPQQDGMFPNTEPHRIGLLRLCPRNDCKATLTEGSNICRHCSAPCPMPRCTICRFPVKGLSRTCLSCSHVTHISCWNSLDVTVPICPSGCGCFCTGTDGPFTRPSTRLGLTPPFPSMFSLPPEVG